MNNGAYANQGYKDGYAKGFDAGYADGYSRGKTEGSIRSTTYFEGTSIIIPTYNQLGYLKECVESIVRYTNEPYELIIIDNASADGTAEYLKSAQGIRFRINPENLGFAGAVNQGLLMAKGTTLLILNNDAVVTTNWLSNLLACLHSNSQFGIVGPVTNYISGDQLIDVSYADMAEMQRFSQLYNQSDARRWFVTKRLTGFCMLFRREDFIRLGYFDEGFEIGNCEDDDYGLRARLLGMQLIIAKDTFIHHYGSVSMKSLNSRFDEVYANNLSFYSNKWSDPHGMLLLDWQCSAEMPNLKTIDSYPTCVIVQESSSKTYWIENGTRYPIDGTSGKQAVRVSRIDLYNWQLGEVISVEEVNRRLNAVYRAFDDNRVIEGRLVRMQDGSVYQRKGAKLHRFINPFTLAVWQLDSYQPMSMNPCELQVYEEGPPIIPPPVIKAENI
ncbi:glycosyltransferase family 2 protein [Paenibacillus sp. DMB20]|uniref:glycosyltransferase family 2 protein n=1 Tax=Paenibacillus sp. DMB20 TaxID=1642570 RepID=UPI000627FF42|nr:glycosyltransferase family 2 protein [Paenibacillus sp. DMB20]KKO54278.1 glycosyl transferase family 2 [Paenibacillus sp. DMB20]